MSSAIFIHLFSGARRAGDLSQHLVQEGLAAGIALEVINVDLLVVPILSLNR